jgi:hypothetical protein
MYALNGRNMFQRPENIPKFSFQGLKKIYLNWDFWFENIPSGRPVRDLSIEAFLPMEKILFRHYISTYLAQFLANSIMSCLNLLFLLFRR